MYLKSSGTTHKFPMNTTNEADMSDIAFIPGRLSKHTMIGSTEKGRIWIAEHMEVQTLVTVDSDCVDELSKMILKDGLTVIIK